MIGYHPEQSRYFHELSVRFLANAHPRIEQRVHQVLTAILLVAADRGLALAPASATSLADRRGGLQGARARRRRHQARRRPRAARRAARHLGARRRHPRRTPGAGRRHVGRRVSRHVVDALGRITGYKIGLGQASSQLPSVRRPATPPGASATTDRRTPRDRVQPDRPGRPAQERPALVPGHPLRPTTSQFDEAAYREHLAWLAELPRRRPVRRRRHGRGLLAHARRRPTASSAPPSTRSPAPCPSSRPPPAAPPTPSPRPRPRRPPAPTASCSCRRTSPRPSQAGLVEHVSAVCRATGLGVIVYSRANAVLRRRRRRRRLADRNPNLIGFKDGVGEHRADDPHLRPGRRPADLRRRPAHRGDLRAAAAAARREHLLLGALQLRAAVGARLLRRRARARTATRSTRCSTSSCIPYLDIRDRDAGLRRLHRQGRPRRDRPPRRPGPPAADRPARRGGRRAPRPDRQASQARRPDHARPPDARHREDTHDQHRSSRPARSSPARERRASADVAAATAAAAEAFATYRATTPEQRARVPRGRRRRDRGRPATRSSRRPSPRAACPQARIAGEVGRTTGQLRLFAAVVRQGDYLGVRIDPALPDRAPLPRADIRQRQIPLGPVAVFGASNFPLAFSTAGGDTASALAAGCPVVVKAHPAHPRHRRARRAARSPGPSRDHGLPPARSRSCSLRPAAVEHRPGAGRATRGSRRSASPAPAAAGSPWSRTAAARPEPIPVYAEMSSINPVVVLPGALAEGDVDGARDGVRRLADPGLPASSAPTPACSSSRPARPATRSSPPPARPSPRRTGQPMLTPGIADAYATRHRGPARHRRRPRRRPAAPTGGEHAPAPMRHRGAGRAARPGGQRGRRTRSSAPPAWWSATTPSRSCCRASSGLEGQLTATVHCAPTPTPTRPAALLPVLEDRRSAGSSSTAGRPASRSATRWSTAARSRPRPTPAPRPSAPSRSSGSSVPSPTRTCPPSCCPRPSATTTRGG